VKEDEDGKIERRTYVGKQVEKSVKRVKSEQRKTVCI
jgi:hypothetical protein